MTDELKEYRKEYASIVGEFGIARNNLQNTMRSAGNRQYLNEDSDVHVGSEYTKSDYYYFRPSEKLKKQPKLIIKMCMDAYDNVGILKNTIDLMGDFASKGITIVHRNKKIEKFLRQWFRTVKGTQVTERIANNFYRGGNVIVEQINGKIKKSTEEKWKAIGFIDDPVKNRDIPRQYIIHNPMSIEKVGSYLSTERDRFYLNTTADQLSNVNIFTGEATTTQRLENGVVELDQSRIFDYYYKKDDWDLWAKPMTYAIMNELMMLDKVQLADISALDGAISNIRLWSLGSFEHNVFPTREAINKVRRILSNRNGGGVIDLVWGPELTFKESNTEVHKFLGKEKYEAILTLIYAGLGIPPTMTGGAGGGSGMTNNMISIKTLVERLQYGRDILTDFWETQLSRVMRAMGFPGVARVIFTHNALSDEAAEKSLLIDLVDRDIISADSVRGVFGFDPEIEQFKINREARSRGVSMPDKASPYHNPQPEHELKKIALNSGIVTPGEVGVRLGEREDGEESLVEINQKNAETNKKAETVNKPKGDAGRPFNAKDAGPRKKKIVKPRSVGFLTDLIMCQDAYDKVGKILSPGFLHAVGKTNLRKLTKDEYLNMERMKFHCLAHLNDLRGENLDFCLEPKNIQAALNKGDHPKYREAKTLMNEFAEQNGKEPSIEETKEIYTISLTKD
jgi:hypothetical protein